ncbi:MAG: class II aldolase/adducin family protein [Desulfobacterales bacterium]
MADYEAFRKEVLVSARWLCEHGYFGARLGSGGNVSLYLRAEDLIVITPSRKPYHAMAVQDIGVIDSRLGPVEGALPPSTEAALHAGIYLNRTDIQAVVHTHQMYASVLALINQPIPALFDEITYEIGAEVAVIPYALSGTAALADNVVSALQNGCRCYIIQNHGALCLGTDLAEAMLNAELLEKSAQAYFHALCSGRDIGRLPEDAVRQLVKKREESQLPSAKPEGSGFKDSRLQETE